MSKSLRISLLVIFLVLLADQALKFWIKTHMYLGQEFHILGNWFIIHFTENNGMAFGMEFSGAYGKLFLSLFRLGALSVIGYWIYTIIRTKGHPGLLVAVSLIFAGAAGNIIDSSFYGMLFSDSNFQVAQFLPAEGGYSEFLYGRVVDMLYFPIIQGHFPDWFPFWGGEQFLFFRPVFNIADSSITVGVFIILLFQKRFFDDKKKGDLEASELSVTTEAPEN